MGYINNMKKVNAPKRVSSSTRINGQIALDMRKKASRYSISIDRKKKQDKYKCRVKPSS